MNTIMNIYKLNNPISQDS